jgi:rhamnose utilization protein RhaD (predicted bifunctional aldolase and dehydrogenase)/NAD(P)-dependent dehydrogenase (short-subunit alcohol dehydrogenase family)
MKNLWNDREATEHGDDPLGLRVYTSRLLGREPDLVLHGGGNTSVKTTTTDLFGNAHRVIYVKGSGWDLETIEAAGFAPVRLDVLLSMAALEQLDDADMVRAQRAAMLDPDAPSPSVEAILHALIPFEYVDHTHADAVVSVTNTPTGEEAIRDIYGERVWVVPYVMPGFALARTVYTMTRERDWAECDGIILMNHGAFTFADDAKSSYEKMIDLVSRAEAYLSRTHPARISPVPPPEDLEALVAIRRSVGVARGEAVLARWDADPASVGFAELEDVAELATRGPLTPDHVIRTKRTALVVGDDPAADVEAYVESYREYFQRNATEGLTCLDPAPRWAVWPGRGTICFGRSPKEARIVADIKDHTIRAIQHAEALGGWTTLPERDVFDVEYWVLEQAKLARSGPPLQLAGKIALVTGAASGIGLACAHELLSLGAVVGAVDVDPEVVHLMDSDAWVGIECDVADDVAMAEAVKTVVRQYGGLDIIIDNVGVFPRSGTIEEIQPEAWDRSMAVNLTSHQRLWKECIPFLRLGAEPAVVVIASKNVPAPGPGAAAYSVAKAGLTQLARVAALELGEAGIRVNVLHPDKVYDTALWTSEVLEERAAHYGVSVDEYKTRNVLHTEVSSRDVATLACAMAGSLFAKTTGAQIAVDGGDVRVI